MSNTQVIGRVGALAVALGIGTAVVAVPSAASAKHSPSSPPTPNISVSQGRSVAVSIDGVLVRDKGSATAFTPLGSTNSRAVARGAGASASAGSGDTAVARGAGSTAIANTNNAIPDDAAVKRRRVALEGATARADGIDASAIATGFDTNAVARGTDSSAFASDNAIARQTATAGTDQTALRRKPVRGTPEGASARADGVDASATATGIDTNAVARGTDSTAVASDINNVFNAGPADAAIAATDNAALKRKHPGALEGASARADGTDANASAYGFDSSALARGADTIAQAGTPGSGETGNKARAFGAGSQAYAGVSDRGGSDNGNTATATNGGLAEAGGIPNAPAVFDSSNNTAVARGSKSNAQAGTSSDESGFRANAGPGQTVVCPPAMGSC